MVDYAIANPPYGLGGDRVFATVAPIVAAVNIYFISPSVWLFMWDQRQRGVDTTFFVVLIVAFLAAPFVAMALNASGKVAIRKT